MSGFTPIFLEVSWSYAHPETRDKRGGAMLFIFIFIYLFIYFFEGTFQIRKNMEYSFQLMHFMYLFIYCSRF